MSHVESFNGGENVRSTFYRYGGKLYLTHRSNTEGWRVVKLELHGKAYVPSDSEFLGACFVFRSTVLITGVAGPHTVWCHLFDSGLVATALSMILPYTHPYRRLLAPFLVNSFAVNWGAVQLVAQVPDGILFRGSGFNKEALVEMFQHYARTYPCMETFKAEMQRKGLEKLCEGGTAAEGEVHDQGGGHNASGKARSAFPWGYWGLKLYAILERFVADVVDLYYTNDDDVKHDAHLQQFFIKYDEMLPPMVERRPFSRADVPTGVVVRTTHELVDFATSMIWRVTAMHEHTGWTSDIIRSFEMAHTYVSNGDLDDKASLMPDCVGRMQNVFTMALTSKYGAELWHAEDNEVALLGSKGTMAPPMSEFLAFLPQDGSFNRDIAQRFFAELLDLHNELAEANRADPLRAFRTFDPLVLEIGVTV